MSKTSKEIQTVDGWEELKAFTDARIALGRVGVSIPLKESLAFKLSHAHAKDAVFSVLDTDKLQKEIEALELKWVALESKAKDRTTYLQRPDYGRSLDENSKKLLMASVWPSVDICIIISDGLSSTAVNQHAIPLIKTLTALCQQHKYSVAPIVLATQARVALGDPIGELLNAKQVLHLIGERPGLSSFDSMGAYLTFGPKTGLTYERSNCVSNIRPKGLPIADAAQKIFNLINGAFKLGSSGVSLKDNTENDFLLT